VPGRVERPDIGPAKLCRQLGRLDATLTIMGGIVGSGIFINCYVVALHAPPLILWRLAEESATAVR
jgi:hypothetical protein